MKHYDKDLVLDLWANGSNTTAIAACLRMNSSAAVRMIVNRAKQKGDERAQAERSGRNRDGLNGRPRLIRDHSRILDLWASGKRRKEIATILGVGPHVIKYAVRRARRVDADPRAIRRGSR